MDTAQHPKLHEVALVVALEGGRERVGVQVVHPGHLEPLVQPVSHLEFRDAVEVQLNRYAVRSLQRTGRGTHGVRPGAGGKVCARPHSHVIGGVRLKQQHRQARGRAARGLGHPIGARGAGGRGQEHLVAAHLRIVARRRDPIHHQRPGLALRRRNQRPPGLARPRRRVLQAHQHRIAVGKPWRQVGGPFVIFRGNLLYSAIPLSSVFGGTFGNCSLIRSLQGIGLGKVFSFKVESNGGARWQNVRPVRAGTRNGSHGAAHRYDKRSRSVARGVPLGNCKLLSRVPGTEPGRVVESRWTQASLGIGRVISRILIRGADDNLDVQPGQQGGYGVVRGHGIVIGLCPKNGDGIGPRRRSVLRSDHHGDDVVAPNQVHRPVRIFHAVDHDRRRRVLIRRFRRHRGGRNTALHACGVGDCLGGEFGTQRDIARHHVAERDVAETERFQRRIRGRGLGLHGTGCSVHGNEHKKSRDSGEQDGESSSIGASQHRSSLRWCGGMGRSPSGPQASADRGVHSG